MDIGGSATMRTVVDEILLKKYLRGTIYDLLLLRFNKVGIPVAEATTMPVLDSLILLLSANGFFVPAIMGCELL
jgi:hypothetical protein